MINKSTALMHYKREDIQKEMVINAKDREIAIKYGDKGFGARPDVLRYERDILELAKQGATSFHASEEIWENVLQLSPSMHRKDMDNLRIGWDLVIDIDCKILDYSKIAADLVVKVLKFHKLDAITCKFSGNRGFHIGIPFEAFPKKINDIKAELYFPDGARRIALYIKEMIKRPLGESIIKFEKGNFSNIIKKTGMNANDITYYEKGKYGDDIAKLNAEPFLALDTLLISSRHLYRMPYSLHEKSGLCSIPIDPEKILDFRKEMAMPKNVNVSKLRFLDKENVKKGEAKELVVQAFDFEVKKGKGQIIGKKEFDKIETAIPEQFFPPCIEIVTKGLKDGRKRAVFILINFLSSIAWSYDMIERYLIEWNKRNQELLQEVYWKGQLRYHKQRKKRILPPNCDNQIYYKDFHVCMPDNFCSKIKNPVNYAVLKAKKND